MKYLQGKFPILKKIALAKDTYSFLLHCPEVVERAVPGQFVHILVEGFALRRPISICQLSKEKGTLRIVFAIRGKGTKVLSDMREGDFMDMIAPLGHGFTINEDISRVILIGGGIGTPPMLPLAEIFREKATVITGFRSADITILQEDYQKTGAQTILCTDDGSLGRHGFVTEPFAEILASEQIDAVYACGPMPMLKGISDLAIKTNVPLCEVSLEERMACGVGACLGCACKTHKNGEEKFEHVCKNGPVFSAREVCW